MRVRTQSSAAAEHGFADLRWELGFHGAAIDERTVAAIGLVQAGCSRCLGAEFRAAQPDQLRLDQTAAMPRSIAEQMSGKKSVVLEATSLGMVEVLFLLRASKAAGLLHVDCLYVEPIEYKKDVYLDSSWSREFSLSKTLRLEGVRGFAHRLSEIPPGDAKLVAFLGYEGARLAQACEQEAAVVSWKKYAVFGVPGYAPGWDMNALANNIDALERHKFDSVRYCSAASVSAAFELLESVHAEGGSDSACTVVAPFGTKPHGIATAMFLIKHSSYQASALMYDHPDRASQRSTKIRRWHLYRIALADEPG